MILAPHPDDGELGCGGTISKLAQEGKTLHYVAFSLCEESVPDGLPRNVLQFEMKAALGVLGILEDRMINYDYPVRRFPEFRQVILEEMIKIRRDVRPDLVLMPAPADVHQDHQVVCNEARRAFKHSAQWGYEMPHNDYASNTNCFVVLSKAQLHQKCAALECYRSQGRKSYMHRGYIESLARVRGTQINREYAEAFEIVRWVVS